MYFLKLAPEKCTGCYDCQIFCAYQKTKSFKLINSCIKLFIFDNSASYIPYACLNCKELWCKTYCPVDAIKVNKNYILIKNEICIGCGLCVLVCPYGAIFFDPVMQKPLKCDLCQGKPACIPVCKKGAIILEEKLPENLSKIEKNLLPQQ
jgi:Fe-S-cluster-containing hydrogenase component 2